MTALAQQWRGQGPLWTPAAFQAVTDRGLFQAHYFAPFGHGQGLASKRHRMVTAIISVLLLACRPSDIARSIWPVIVDAVKRMSRRWSLAYVGSETRQVVQPHIGHDNPALSVVLVWRSLWVVTARFNALPEASLVGVMQAVSGVSGFGNLSLKAAATPRWYRGVSQAASKYRGAVAAVAQTVPVCGARISPDATVDYHQAAESLTCQVHERRHTGIVAENAPYLKECA